MGNGYHIINAYASGSKLNQFISDMRIWICMGHLGFGVGQECCVCVLYRLFFLLRTSKICAHLKYYRKGGKI